MYDVNKVRADFPILAKSIYGKPLVYLDNANTTQKPNAGDRCSVVFLSRDVPTFTEHPISSGELSTRAYENARETVQHFLNAAEPHEIVFTRNATEGVNLVAQTFGRANIGAGDEVVISTMEHHCNIVPWQMLAERPAPLSRLSPSRVQGSSYLIVSMRCLPIALKLL